MSVPLFSNIKDLSLYFHIPFCAQKCSYCDFYSESSSAYRFKFIELLKNEIKLHIKNSPNIAKTPIKTIFFGGGTPSVLTAKEWLEIGYFIKDSFNLSQLEEWSVECNPESFTEEKAKTWLKIGINRLSFGVQSLNSVELVAASRIHTRERVLDLLQMDVLKEFASINIDIIYALPFQTVSSLSETIKTLLSFKVVKHISAYELTLAEGTPLFENPKNIPNEKLVEELTDLAHRLLKDAGFTRYEVSNFAKTNTTKTTKEQCKHNLRYWRRDPYLGFGPSAHSFDGCFRWDNLASLQDYSQKIESAVLPNSLPKKVSLEEAKEEFLFLSLRLGEGFLESDFLAIFGENFNFGGRKKTISLLIKEGMIEQVGDSWRVTELGFGFVDGVVERLLFL